MFKLFTTYHRAKDVFTTPKLIVNFGLWKHMRGLPVWRAGNVIRFGKTSFHLPIWLSFYIFNLDIGYKWKFDDICFEHPPQFTAVFLALHFL